MHSRAESDSHRDVFGKRHKLSFDQGWQCIRNRSGAAASPWTVPSPHVPSSRLSSTGAPATAASCPTSMLQRTAGGLSAVQPPGAAPSRRPPTGVTVRPSLAFPRASLCPAPLAVAARFCGFDAQLRRLRDLAVPGGTIIAQGGDTIVTGGCE